MKRIFCVMLALSITAGLLSGCNGGGSSGGENKPMGRYIEEQGQVLENVNEVFDFHRTATGETVFYAMGLNENELPGYKKYVLPKDGGALESSDVVWLNDLMGAGGWIGSISEGTDGTVYALHVGEDSSSTLYRAEAGGMPEAVTVPDWVADVSGTATTSMSSADTEIEGAAEGDIGMTSNVFAFAGDISMQKVPNRIFALADGFLSVFSQGGVSRYSADGNLVAQFEGGNFGRVASVFGDQMLINGANMEILGYDLLKNEKSGTYTYDNLNFFTTIGLDGEGIFLADATGIYRQAKDGSIWERLVDGDLTSLAMPNQNLAGLAGDGSGGFYGLMNSGEQHQMMHYVYSKETPTSPDTELTIFGLKDNNTVRQAIGEFQRQNPNVRVNFRIAMGEDSAATVEDVVRSLNTEILAGKGPDLLLLDGLPVDAYIEKGVLVDLSDFAADLTATQGLLPNLMNAYQKEGKTYGVASRFAFPVMMGLAEYTDKIKSLPDLVGEVAENQSGEPPLLFPPDTLWQDGGMLMDYYAACVGDWMGADGTIDETALANYLSQMVTLNQTMRENTPQSGGMAAITITASAVIGGRGLELGSMGPMNLNQGNARFHIQNLAGMMNLSLIVSNLEHMGGQKLDTLFGGDRYLPLGGVGLVSAGAQQELAQKFMEMLLSQTVQDKYLYDGFPINSKSLEKLTADTLKEISGVEGMGFLALCDKLATPVLTDQVIEDAVKSQVKDLLAGTITPEAAAAQVVDKTKIYLSE